MTNHLDYPSRPVRLMTGAPGGGVDFLTRLIAQALTRSLGHTVTAENLPAETMGEVLSKALPDGHTLLVTGMILWLTPFLRNNVSYDPIADLAPITLAVNSPNILVVNPSLPVQSVKELISFANARPRELKFTSAGTGSSAHLAGELFKAMAGINIVHHPSKGGVTAIDAVAAGEMQLMFSATPVAQSYVTSGKVRALAVTSPQPSTLFPSLPAVATSGVPGYEFTAILGLFAPAHTPPPVIDRLNRDTVQFLNRAGTTQQLLDAGLEVVGSTPGEFAAVIKAEMTRLGKVINAAGIQAH